MRKSWWFLGAGFVLVAVACGGSSRSNERDGMAKGGSGPQPNEHGTIDHAYVPLDACANFSNPSCIGEGILCKPITEDRAASVCITNPSFGSCNPRTPVDQCCDSTECPDGATCLYGQPYPREEACGVPPDAGYEGNRCSQPDCVSDADCPSGVCTVENLFGVRRCLAAACKSDADCSERPGGACRYFWGGCCNLGKPGSGGCDSCVATLPGPYRSQALVCTYPDDGCRYDSDCPKGSQCTVKQGVAACRTECTENDFVGG
jgi:hypothetical protein